MAKNKFSLTQFVWYGFNLTVGIFFLGSLATFINPPGAETHGAGIGWFIIPIFLIMGIIAYVCARAFSRMSTHHKQDNFGGAYIFARANFNRFIGFIIIFLNYIILPLTLCNQILNFIKANFDPDFIGHKDSGDFNWLISWTNDLGNWKSFTFDMIALVLIVVIVVAVFYGMKTFKKVSKYTLLIKWIASGFLILFGIVSACMFAYQHGDGNINYWTQTTIDNMGTKEWVTACLNAFCACFYYFTGFETFATAGKTIDKPEKNISKGIAIVMLMATLFYIVMIVLFMFAQGKNEDGFDQQNAIGFWLVFKNVKELKWLIYAGPIIMIIAIFFSRSNNISQLLLYGGTTLQPMSAEGYISDKFQKTNKDNFPISAMKLHLIISTITCFIWLIIPDIIVGIFGEKADFININTIINGTSVFYILIYVFILLVVLKMVFDKLIKINWFEVVMYFICLLVLSLIFVEHFVNLISDMLTGETDKLVAGCVEFGFFLGCILFVVLTYFIYYKKKYLKRMSSHPDKQKHLDSEFVLLDGWHFTFKKLQLSLQKFLKTKRAKQKKLKDDDFIKWNKLQSKKILKKTTSSINSYKFYANRINKYNLKKHHIDTSLIVNKHIQQANLFNENIHKKILKNI